MEPQKESSVATMRSFRMWGDAADRLGLSRSGKVRVDSEYQTALERVVARIERESGYKVCGGPRHDGAELDFMGRTKANHYEIALGTPSQTGGYTSAGRVWISIPVER
jgi:hypothetical protein